MKGIIENKLKFDSVKREKFMERAIYIARGALDAGEFPVGCVIEYKNRILAEGVRMNSMCKGRNELDHAEINALKELSMLDYECDSSELTIYSTLEPCLMCLGAILISGINKIVFAYEDVMGGSMSCDLSKLPILYNNSNFKIISGILRTKSLVLFKLFFMESKNSYWHDSKLSHYTLEQDSY